MGTEWGREDDEQLARWLAPVLGEDAVYTYTFRCPGCHKETVSTNSLPTYCSGIHGGRTVWMTCYAEPVPFGDPAVGWPLWERWDVPPDWTVTVYRERGDGFEASVWQDEPGCYCKGDTTTEAVARAWLAALEAGANA